MRQRRFESLPAATPETVSALADDHPAILLSVPLFEKQVVSAEDSPSLLVSGANNRKIGRVVTKGSWKGMPIYTLTLAERTTCPASCYMFKSCYGNAMPFARRHAPGPEFEKKLESEIWAKSREHPSGFVVRLHVLGDFYSSEYVAVWARLLSKHPQVHAYGYTARIADNEDRSIGEAIVALRSRYPDRFVVRSSEPAPVKGGATVIDRTPEAANVPEGLVCPAEREATACCATCGLCWEPASRDKTIVFVRHGKGSSKGAAAARTAAETDESGMRRVQPLESMKSLAGSARNDPPTMLWVKPTELCVDETYQRTLSRKSMSLITKIVQGWDWTHFKPPIVVKDEERDLFFVLDGQHTAIAAASHPGIQQISGPAWNADR